MVRLRGRATLSTARLRCQRLEKVPSARLVWRAHGEPLVGPRSRRVRRAPRTALGRGPGAARLHLAADRPRSRSRAARRRQHLAQGDGDDAGRRARGGAVREGKRLGPGGDRAARASRGGLGTPAQAARARRAVRRGDGEPAPHAPLRRGRAQPLGRDAAPRLPAPSLHRPHARRRRAGGDQPAARRGGGAGARGLRPALGDRALRHARLRARQAGGRGLRARPVGRGAGTHEPRPVHLRRRRAHGLRADDRRRRPCRALRARAGAETLDILAGPDAARIADANPLTPDHVIRTKGPALLLPAGLPLDDAKALRERVDAAVANYRAAYDAYFETNRPRARTGVTKLDSLPRVILVPGVGLFTAGRTKQDARIAADIAEHTLGAKALANAIGRYTALSDGDLFDMEYWSLEQAKLGGAKEAALAGQVALVTGAAGAIGFAICRKLIDAGAHVVAADRDGERLDAAVGELDPRRRGLAAGVMMDVTDERSVAAGCAEACRLYGGVDILVLNAGVAHVSPIEATDAAAFRRVVDVNLTGHFLVLREAAALFRRQGTGGNVIVNSSKNVFAPGPTSAPTAPPRRAPTSSARW